MFELKPIAKDAIPEALRKAERYRLLNQPQFAESICLDILAVDPEHQEAALWLLLSLTDQLGRGATVAQARAVLARITDPYERAYCAGIVCERWAEAQMRDANPGYGFVAHEYLTEAMSWYEKAEAVRPAGNDDAILRWNTCARILMRNPELRPRPEEEFEPAFDD